MSVENENRDCNCNKKDNCQVDASIAALNNNFIANDMLSNNDMCPCNMDNMTMQQLLHHIKCYNFAIVELALYLDTHPDDEKAICLHNKYCKEYKELTDKYQKIYGPLTITYPCNKWRWLEEPWPWEGGMN